MSVEHGRASTGGLSEPQSAETDVSLGNRVGVRVPHRPVQPPRNSGFWDSGGCGDTRPRTNTHRRQPFGTLRSRRRSAAFSSVARQTPVSVTGRPRRAFTRSRPRLLATSGGKYPERMLPHRRIRTGVGVGVLRCEASRPPRGLKATIELAGWRYGTLVGAHLRQSFGAFQPRRDARLRSPRSREGLGMYHSSAFSVSTPRRSCP